MGVAPPRRAFVSSFCASMGEEPRFARNFLFLSHSLNTEFEHTGMNTSVCQWGLKRVGAELCSDLCSKQKKKQLRLDS